MASSRRTGFPRALLAFSASLVAIAMCVGRGHVRILLDDPATYASPFQHRCGLLMVACVAWAMIELALYFRPVVAGDLADR